MDSTNNIRINFEADTRGIDDVYKSLDTLQDRERQLKDQIAALSKEYESFKYNLSTSGKTQEQVANEVAAAQKKMSDAQRDAQTELKNTKRAITDLHTQADKLEAAMSKSTATKMLRTQLNQVKNEMADLNVETAEGAARWDELAKKGAELQTNLAKASRGVKGLSSDSQALTAAMGIGQGLTGTFTMAQSAMALFGGESEELQKTFFKVQAGLQVLNGAQMLSNTLLKSSTTNTIIRNAVSGLFQKNLAKEAVATNIQTAATVKADAATKKWTLSLLANPVFWIVAGLMALIPLVAKFIGSIETQAKKQKELNELEALRLERLEKTSSKIQSNADRSIKNLERELEIMKSLGAAESEQAAIREQILQTRLGAAQSIEKQAQKEITNLDENNRKLEQIQKNLDAINKAKIEGSKYAVVEVNGVVRWVKPDKKKTKDLVENMEKELENTQLAIKLGIESNESLREADKNLDVFYNDQTRKNRERALKDAAIIAQVRLDATRKGTEQELQARINVLEKEKAVTLSNIELTEAERLKINTDAERKIADLRREFEKQQLVDEKVGMEARLAQVKEGTQEEFELRKQLAMQQLEIDLSNVDLTLNEQNKLYNEFYKNIEQLNKDYNKKVADDALNTQIAVINARLAEVEKGSQLELQLLNQVAEKQAELERRNIEATITNEELKAAMILEINAKLNAELLQNQKAFHQASIDNTLRNIQIELEAERLKNEEILLTGGIFERIKARTELSKHELRLIEAEKQALDDMFASELISREEYNQRVAEMENEASAARINIIREEEAAKQQIREAATQMIIDSIVGMFDQEKALLQQRLADMKEFYTTDANEAANNADKQLITQEELARREKAIKRQMAEADQKKAIFDATMSMFKAIANAWTMLPPFGAIYAGVVAAATGMQIARIKSQPLPGFAKGKKSRNIPGGQLSEVGEVGREVMWVPNNAAIIPHNKSKNITADVLREFNINIPEYPTAPHLELQNAAYRKTTQGIRFDYDKLGKAVAKNIPEMSQLNVSLDDNGFSKYIVRKNTRTKILNSRFGLN